MHEAGKELFANESVAEGFVTVDMAATGFLAVVEVYGTKVAEAYGLLKFVESESVAHFVAEVVAGGKGVAGVYADTDAAFVVDAFDDAGNVGEGVAKVGALSGGVLNDGGDSFGLGQGRVYFTCYLV